MSLHEQLKKVRLQKQLTQQQIADALLITNSTYCGYETGKRKPDADKIKRLAETLNVSVDTLLEINHDNNNSDVLFSQKQIFSKNLRKCKTELIEEKSTGTPPSFLLGLDDDPPHLSAFDNELISIGQCLSETGKEKLLIYAKDMLKLHPKEQ